MKLLKIFAVVGVLLSVVSVASAIPNTPGSPEDTEYQVVPFTLRLKEAPDKSPEAKMCGKYFAEIEVEGEKFVLFIFEKRLPDDQSAITFVFTPTEWLTTPSINEKAASPTVTLLGEGRHVRFRLKMNMPDYKTGLPCISKGTDI